MERMQLMAVLVAAAAMAAVVFVFLTFSYIPPPAPCPLKFGVVSVNTTFGWMYVVAYLQDPPEPLSVYNVTAFTSVANATGGDTRLIEYEGPLTGILGSSGNVSFQDRGAFAGYLDNGDYFLVQAPLSVWVYRGDQPVGGTIGCV